jgi:hypothetical protein
VNNFLPLATIVSVLISLGSSSTRAAASPITWIGGAHNTTSAAADVNNSGSFVDGVYMGSTTTAETIGTTTFYPEAGVGTGSVSSAGAGPGDINISTADVFGGDIGTTAPGYLDVLSRNAYGPGSMTNVVTMTFSHLTSGVTYQFQIWSATPNGEMQTFTDGTHSVTLNGTPTPGQFALGQFTAVGTTESLTYTGPNAGFPVVNAIDLRLVPEPASVLLMILGGIGLCLAGLRRGRRK